MRIRTAIAAAAATLSMSSAALAISNPLVEPITPVGPAGVAGNVTLFQIGSNVNLGLNVSSGSPGAIDLRKGSCKSYDAQSRPLGNSQQVDITSTTLSALVGNVVLIHKGADAASPVVGCAQIKGS